MKSFFQKKQGSLKVLALILGLAISGVIIGQGLTGTDGQVAKNSSFDSLKETIKTNKNLIVNTYLLGVSIYQEATE